MATAGRELLADSFILAKFEFIQTFLPRRAYLHPAQTL
jgi:hypothetical protein